MSAPQPYLDWRDLVAAQRAEEPATSSRHRLRWLMALFAAALATVFVRAVQLEISDGGEFRRWAAQSPSHTVALPAPRGRILTRDGAVLATDRTVSALAIHYRYVQQPSDPAWLRRIARSRLSKVDRRKPERIAEAEQAVRREVHDLHARLAKLCALSLDQWQARAERITRRVERLAARVNVSRQDRFAQADDDSLEPAAWSWGTLLTGLFAPPAPLPPPLVVVAEQDAYHLLVDDIDPLVVAEINAHPQLYPQVKIVSHTRREYPLAMTAANLVGHVALDGSWTGDGTAAHPTHVDKVVGLLGAEHRFEETLRGAPGSAIERTNHRGKLLDTAVEREPTGGRDLVLSIDVRIQSYAEELLDRTVQRAERSDGAHATPHGGAIVVMDVGTGELLAAAGTPRFDPNLFAVGDPRAEAVVNDPRRPLFDRATKMALPPGSVFKSLTALALLAGNRIDSEAALRCAGYLDDPKHLRCQLFRQHGVGHGDVVLADALAQSCNVFFFHHARQLGGPELLAWATRLGFGLPTGVDVAGEPAGTLPSARQLDDRGQTELFAVGQGAFTATPLQVARLYALIANGSHPLRPRITKAENESGRAMGEAVTELDARVLEPVREGLRRVVEDPNGTAYSSRIVGLTFAGKTGTAQAGSDTDDHAWFAGYVPADAPRYAFAVALEHGGAGSDAAASVVKPLLKRMRQLGYLGVVEPAETATGGHSAKAIFPSAAP